MDTLLNPPTDTTDVEKISKTLDRLFARLPIPERLKQHLTMLERLSRPLATVIAKIHQTSGLPDKLTSREDVMALFIVDGLVAFFASLVSYKVIKTLLYLLIGNVLWFIVAILYTLIHQALVGFDSLTVLAPAYMGLYVLKVGEGGDDDEEIESKGNATALSWLHHILSLPPPMKPANSATRKSLSALVLAYFGVLPVLNLFRVFLPFSVVTKPVLSIFVFHPMYSVLPWLFKNAVQGKPWFATVCLLGGFDMEHMPSTFEGLVELRKTGVIAPMISMSGGNPLRSVESEEWSEVDKTDAVECRIVKLKVREVDVGDNENDDVIVVVKQVANGRRKVNPKIETLIYKTPTLKVGKVDTAALDIPVVPARNVSLILEVRGKMTFGSDPVLSTHKLDIETMFVGNTMMKKASDVEISGGGGCRVVVDVECDDATKYI